MKKHKNNISSACQMFRESATALDRWDNGDNLNRVLREYSGRSLLANLLYNLFRHRAVIDWIIDRHLSHQVEQKLRNVLRIALTDILYLQGPPPQVITDVAVRFTKERYSDKKARFINAVLRNILRETADAWLEKAKREGPPPVSLELSPELYRQWKRRDPEELNSLSRLLTTPAPLIVRAVKKNTDYPPDPGEFLERFPSPEWAEDEDFYKCTDAAAMFSSRAFLNGDFYLQDPATLLAVKLLNPAPGETAADLCCAPGGKSICLAEKMNEKGMLLCMDRSHKRLKMAAGHIERFANAFASVAKVEEAPLPPASLDAVLLDVPCSNTGVIRRRPDIRWHFSRENLSALITVQQRMLEAAADLLKPGGRLVYSTCSIEPEENQGQIHRFLKRHSSFKMADQKSLSPESGHDGAYAALITH